MELNIRADLVHSFQDRSFVIWSGDSFIWLASFNWNIRLSGLSIFFPMCMFELVSIVIDTLKKSAIDLLSRSGLTFIVFHFHELFAYPCKLLFPSPS